MTDSSSTSIVKNQIIRAGLAGAIGTIGSMMYFGESGNISAFGLRVPANAAIFGTVFASDLVAQNFSTFVLSKIPTNESYANLEGSLIGPVLSGGSLILILGPLGQLIDSNMYGSAFVLGAASTGLGAYGYNNIIYPMLSGGTTTTS